MNKKVYLFAILPILLTSCNSKLTEYSIHTQLQENYLKDDYKNILSYATGIYELSKPNPVSFTWDGEGEFVLSLEENNEIIKEYNVSENKIELYNLKVGYEYSLYVKQNNTEITSFSFKTSDIGPRNLDIDGVTNSRDLGGYKIDKKHRVKQGLIYRTSKYNEDQSDTKLITQKGIDTLINDLGVKTELDLRRTSDNESGITSSPLGEVKYISLPMVSNGNVLKLNKSLLPKLFEILGNMNNYPMAFHCSIGTDRTGLVAFLFNAILGVSEEDLYRDYLFSNFGNIKNTRTVSAINAYIEEMDLYEGNSLKDKVYNYLLNNGVKEEYIQNIRNNFIENI